MTRTVSVTDRFENLGLAIHALLMASIEQDARTDPRARLSTDQLKGNAGGRHKLDRRAVVVRSSRTTMTLWQIL